MRCELDRAFAGRSQYHLAGVTGKGIMNIGWFLLQHLKFLVQYSLPVRSGGDILQALDQFFVLNAVNGFNEIIAHRFVFSRFLHIVTVNRRAYNIHYNRLRQLTV